MRILYLTSHFRPDLGAGAFRNSSLFEALLEQLHDDDFVHVITTTPHRYQSYQKDGLKVERGPNYRIDRVEVPQHGSGFLEQVKAFTYYYQGTMRLIKGQSYDRVFASSSLLLTAFLGKRCSEKNHCSLILDVRDILADTIKDYLNSNIVLQKPVVWALGQIERYSFGKADHINLISGGFRNYFKKYPYPRYTEYTHGVDDLFIDAGKSDSNSPEKPYVITYAGNIGLGQGLEKIIPEAARRLGPDYKFRVIGDGGARHLLETSLQALGVRNVELLKPMDREKLVKYYQSSTYLFIHLNNLKAFEKVLPSKLFEYGAFDKPIVAGVSGYAAEFIKQYLPNHILFPPTDVNALVTQLKSCPLQFSHRPVFTSQFSRRVIDSNFAKIIYL